ncbi:hypothetical protein [Luteolibacter luteus]|uniref:AsmA-like C-terminal region-containing protein n=1 Tax=Luteolibacter luteus TaxID=2728835 RepID=A0A858REM7_9BACT|nr:hypothetical protein [Luteolibacter luteus]QJE95185.1 AsmA-like C-terminal region-containing protein [Luteolibacter luteus]
MSRRQRRRAGTGEAKGISRWWVRGIVAALIFGVVAMGGGYLWLRSWLHGESFRHMLAASADKELRVKSEFGPFQWSGTRMDTTGFQASGEGLVRSIDAEGLQVEIGLGGWWKDVWQVDDARAKRIEIEIDTTAAERVKDLPSTGEDTARPKAKKWYDSLVPHEVELRQVEFDRSSLSVLTKSGTIGILGTFWRLTPDGAKGSYRAEGSDGVVQMPWKWAPPMQLGRARLRYQEDTVFLTDADFQVYESGRLDLSGEMSAKGKGYAFNGYLRDVSCAEILPEDWKQRLAGNVDAEFSVDKRNDKPAVSGHLNLTDGMLTALPLLDALSAYADTSRFRRLTLQDAKADFEWEDGALTLRNLVLASEGLVRLEGALRVDKQERLDGRFRLGLVPGVLAKIPGAETSVFSPGERGLLWTDLHITGTVDKPEEDLTARLIEAAGMRMIEILPETGEKVLKFTQQVVGEDLQAHLKNAPGLIKEGTDLIDKGRDTLKEAEGVVREVGGLFDALRGKDEEKKE